MYKDSIINYHLISGHNHKRNYSVLRVRGAGISMIRGAHIYIRVLLKIIVFTVYKHKYINMGLLYYRSSYTPVVRVTSGNC